MQIRMIALGCSAMTLMGCDAAVGELDNQLRDGFVAQCQQVSESLGVSSARVSQVCECSADKFMAGDLSERSQIDRAKVEEILNTCLLETGTNADDAKAETPNG